MQDELYSDLSENQKVAVFHDKGDKGHARLLAGPGTGKTKVITNRVLWLCLNKKVDPKDILVLTFTRLAAQQLKDEISKELEEKSLELPNIATLHSFALHQILYNQHNVSSLPAPLRIADDWEERHIIDEDLKTLLGCQNIKDVKKLVQQLSADWENLRADQQSWEEEFPDPKFIGAWQLHRATYGITLRSELVYQLKKALKTSGNFKLDHDYKHIIIDEYQDFNPCDLAIVYELERRGSTLFVAGDDDQSIYGFRFADPEGIRRFTDIFANTTDLNLETCYRCDKSIFRYSELVASLDPKRLPKGTKPRDTAGDGLVELIRCKNQDHEAKVITGLIKKMLGEGLTNKDIVILMRSSKLSTSILPTLETEGLHASLPVESEFDDSSEFQALLSYLRLCVNPEDSLALRALLQCERNGVGEECFKKLNDLAYNGHKTFKAALDDARKAGVIDTRFSKSLYAALDVISSQINSLKAMPDLNTQLETLIHLLISEGLREKVKKFFDNQIAKSSATNPEELLKSLISVSDKEEQDVPEGCISVLTMHQAKGLTFSVAVIVGVEDEIIPGRQEGEFEGDERRLLYVSMTRAKNKLYMTYCDKRTGQQSYTGRDPGSRARSLTRFLADAKLPLSVAN
jgi:DNA helicase-2/ATP-dependent DNA helicase PcrA